MYAYMTKGTYDFLHKLESKHPDISIYFMGGDSGALAYYEGDHKNIFAAGRSFDILEKTGEIQQEGYVVMNNIPVTEDGGDKVEEQFKQRNSGLSNMTGFQAFRLLRPKKGNTYVVLTQWHSEADFDNWKNSAAFKNQHANQAAKPPAYIMDKPFITSYHMIKDED